MLVILQSTNACNLRCRYCSVDSGSQPRKDLVESDCQMLVSQLPAILKDGEPVSWLWHGGEPMMLNPNQFLRMREILDSIAEQGHPVAHRMQTNGFSVSKAWIQALVSSNVSVGVSIDGPQELHDYARLTALGKSSYARIAENITRMQEAGIPLALLCTVGPHHLGREEDIVTWVKKTGIPVRFNPLLKLGRAEVPTSLSGYFGFLKKIFILLLNHYCSISIQPLEWMIRSTLLGTPPEECSYSGTCGKNLFAYGPEGAVSLCNRSSTPFGFISKTPLSILRKEDMWKSCIERFSRLNLVCESCTCRSMCNGGCRAHEGVVPEASNCTARREFFAWLEKEGLELIREALLRRRAELRKNLDAIGRVRAFFEQKGNVSPEN